MCSLQGKVLRKNGPGHRGAVGSWNRLALHTKHPVEAQSLGPWGSALGPQGLGECGCLSEFRRLGSLRAGARIEVEQNTCFPMANDPNTVCPQFKLNNYA